MNKHNIFKTMIAVIFTGTCMSGISGCQSSSNKMDGLSTDAGVNIGADEQNELLDDQWGVRVLGIKKSAAGLMLDFRYRVTDAEKAMSILDSRTKCYLIAEKDGYKFQVPSPKKLGPLRSRTRQVKADKNYFTFFANPGRYIKSGDLVTVVMGDFKAEHIVVQ